jgi:hypothetical protein
MGKHDLWQEILNRVLYTGLFQAKRMHKVLLLVCWFPQPLALVWQSTCKVKPGWAYTAIRSRVGQALY